MRYRYKSALMLVFLLIVGCLGLSVSYAFYFDYSKNDSEVIVDGDITVNYLHGNKFNQYDDLSTELSITNNSNNDNIIIISLSSVIAENADYAFIDNDTNEVYKGVLKNANAIDNIVIEAHKTKKFTFNIDNKSEEVYSAKLNIAVKETKKDLFSEIIINNNKVKEDVKIDFSKTAVENEGLIKSNEDKAASYYFRGNIDNNYVMFENLLWRIVKINSDGSVKLVLNNTIETLTKYYDNGYYFKDSTINEVLNKWYDANLSSKSNIIANFRFCNDNTLESNLEYSTSYNRVMKNFIPTTTCLGNTALSRIGLLTIDEVALAGATKENNKDFYLYNNAITNGYYLMSPSKIVNNKYYPFLVTKDGAIDSNTSGDLLRGVRPVINIVKNVTVTGTGAEIDPYIIQNLGKKISQ